MIPSASNDVSINVVEQCLQIINNNYCFNGLKGSIKMQKRYHYLNINNVSSIIKGMVMLFA